MNPATEIRATMRTPQNPRVIKTNPILGMQVLVLCLDREVFRSLAWTLLDLGVAPMFLQRTEVALEVLRRKRFDLVVVNCDEIGEGSAAIEEIRRTEANKNATILALVDQQNQIQGAFQIGATLALQKPVSTSLLRRLLHLSKCNIGMT